MTVRYGFYNSLGGDRVYDAIDIGSMFDGVLTDGVFELIGDQLAVDENSGMTVLVKTGKAWFNGTWTINDENLVLNIVSAHPTLDRIDTVVLEVDATTSIRANSIKVVTGTPASTPSPPTLEDTEDIHQYPLAYISVDAGVSSIVAGDIEITVGTGLCPFVTVPQAGDTVATVLEVEVFS